MLCMIRFGFQRKATTAVAALSPAQDCSLEPNMSSRHEQVHLTAVLSPETSILIQKRHPYPGNLNSETSGDNIYSDSETLALPWKSELRNVWGQ